MRILSIDPGDHTGWCYIDDSAPADKMLQGGTLPKDYLVYAQLLEHFASNLDIILVESFHLFATHAKTLTNNTFYTCEVIGILKYLALVNDLKLKLQQPADKKFTNKSMCEQLYKLCNPAPNIPIHEHFLKAKKAGVSEHTRDAIQHLVHFMMGKEYNAIRPEPT